MSARFLSLEGIDGAGKTTHLEALERRWRSQHADVVRTREPGGTPLAEKIRALVLHEPMGPLPEALAELGFGGRIVATAVNGDFVPARKRAETCLSEGDRIEIVDWKTGRAPRTPQEREDPKILNASRRKRIANGSGVSVSEVNQLIERFNQAKKMMSKMAGQFGMGGMGGRSATKKKPKGRKGKNGKRKPPKRRGGDSQRGSGKRGGQKPSRAAGKKGGRNSDRGGSRGRPAAKGTMAAALKKAGF